MNLLHRTLLKNGRPRQGVMACLYKAGTDIKVAAETSNENGYFEIDVTGLVTGYYDLKYYGGGVNETLFDPDTGVIIEQDAHTPWEFDLEIIQSSVSFDTTPPANSVVSGAALES